MTVPQRRMGDRHPDRSTSIHPPPPLHWLGAVKSTARIICYRLRQKSRNSFPCALSRHCSSALLHADRRRRHHHHYLHRPDRTPLQNADCRFSVLLSPPHHTISRLVRVSQAPLSLSLVINIHMHFTANLKNPNQTHIYIQLSYARSYPLNQEERFLSQVFPVICRQHQPGTFLSLHPCFCTP